MLVAQEKLQTVELADCVLQSSIDLPPQLAPTMKSEGISIVLTQVSGV